MSEIDSVEQNERPADNASSSAPPAPPGWYIITGGQHRYWDGSQWAGASASDPDGRRPPTSAPSVRPQRISRRLRLGLIFGGLGFVVLAVVITVVAVQLVTGATTLTAKGLFDLSDSEDGSACLPHE
jgi:hypothetical protein